MASLMDVFLQIFIVNASKYSRSENLRSHGPIEKRKLTKNKSVQREIPYFQSKINIKLKRFLLKSAKKVARSRLIAYGLNAFWSAAAIDLLGKTA